MNRSLKSLTIQGYIDEQIQPTNKTIRELRGKITKECNHISSRFWNGEWCLLIPSIPKALIEVDGQPIIERGINQLNSIGVKISI